ncbi:prostaglandin E synthase isoform X3 [Struthio camelus]|uniref:prostaglandin E synthase isoform X3 n=1 Tax=Struthio camelus TaxID=8801 RepID=UPI00051E4FEB|nr:PREDICTED: prostaglandin E synthase isoform X2 [Struthio camelus australis]
MPQVGPVCAAGSIPSSYGTTLESFSQAKGTGLFSAGWKEPPALAHRNDMENIFPFLFLGAVYSLLDPSPTVARIHFFIFCLGRIVHTVAYLLRLKAPTRSVAYSVAQLPCFSMALQILIAAIPYW